MKKSKKSTKKRKSNASENQNKAYLFIASAVKNCAAPGAYEHILKISDETPIREIESKLNGEDKQAFCAYMTGNLDNLNSTNRKPVGQSKAYNHPEFIRRVFAEASSVIIADAFTPRNGPQRELFAIVDIVNEKIMDRIPRKFFDTDGPGMMKKHIRIQFSDVAPTLVYDMIDWDAIMKGNNFPTHMKNLNKLLRAVLPEEIQVAYDRAADDIITDLASQAVALMPESRAAAIEDLRDLGYDIGDLIKPRCKIPSINPRPLIEAPYNVEKVPTICTKMTLNANCTPVSVDTASPRAKKIFAFTNDEVESIQPKPKSWMLPFLIATNINLFHQTIPFRKKLYETHTYNEIVWTAIRLSSMTACHTQLCETLMNMIIVQQTTTDVCREIMSQKNKGDTEEPCIVIDCDKPRQYNQAVMEQHLAVINEKSTEEIANSDKFITEITLNGLVLCNTDVYLTGKLYIQTRWAELLENLGLSHDEAMVMCGYLEATERERDHVRCMWTFLENNEDIEISQTPFEQMPNSVEIQPLDEEKNNDSAVEEDEREQIRKSAFQESEERFIAERRRITDEIERERRSHAKEQKYARHEVKDLETRLQKQIELNDELKRELTAVKSELTEIRQNAANHLVSIETLAKIENTDTAEKNNWPSDVGQDQKIIVFGGGVNWINELQKRFPKVKFYNPDVIPNETAIAMADIIMINTFVISHKNHHIICDAAQRSGKKPLFFPSHGVNAASEFIVNAVNQCLSGGTEHGQDQNCCRHP